MSTRSASATRSPSQALTASYGVKHRSGERLGDAARRRRRAGRRLTPRTSSPSTADRKIAEAFADSGYAGDDATGMAEAIAKLLNAPALKAGTVLRVGLEVRGDVAKVVRTSVYDRHHASRDHRARRPRPVRAGGRARAQSGIADRLRRDAAAVAVRGNLPTVYDGIYRAAYSYGMSQKHDPAAGQAAGLRRRFPVAAQPVRPHRGLLLAARRRRPDLRRIRSCSTSRRPSAATRAISTASRWKTARSTISTRTAAAPSSSCCATRCRTASSAPASAAAAIRSSAIPRCTPASTGPRPRGSPIIAAGNGVVEKAGWAGGYGRQTIIRHANGYETSYNHQSAHRQRHQAGRARAPGPGDRLCRHDRPVDRRPPALRADRQRPQGRPDARAPAGRQGAEGQGTRSLQARARRASTNCSRKKTAMR